MLSVLWVLSPAFGNASDGRAVGYLECRETEHRRSICKSVPYVPREGDLVFYDDHNPTWTGLFALAGTGPPLHMGIVVK